MQKLGEEEIDEKMYCCLLTATMAHCCVLLAI